MRFFSLETCTALACITLLSQADRADSQDGAIKYGVDVSWPMHHRKISSNYAWLPHNIDPSIPTPEEYKDMPVQPLGDVESRHKRFINGCYEYNQKRNGKGIRCLRTERNRIEMSLQQPQSMRNYTTIGYTKIRAPEHVFKLLKDFWDKNRDKQKLESWAVGNIYTNDWEAPTYHVSLEDESLEGAGYVLLQQIWNAARDTIEKWTGQKQAECSLYGIRIYTTGSILAPHVDRNPLVSSAIINIDQDLDEPWPLEVIGHDGIAHNVTMEPGDLVLYESHSIIHGRPFPLKGRFMANVFIHFEPVGPVDGPIEYDGEFPPFIIPGSPLDLEWRSWNTNGHKLKNRVLTKGANDAHVLAGKGQFEELKRYLDEKPGAILQRDKNGWTPLSEAVRIGHTDCVQLLLDRGSEVNFRLGMNEQDGSLLWYAKHWHGEEHAIVNILKSFGTEVDEPPIF